ncbi:MAG: cupin domain-containing protein [Chitinophagaceae bacterium]|jgi:quercetin dioxygenase-like cupin family protein|nr:cupin domain-containing protein [Chitinophagaceae bacterium]
MSNSTDNAKPFVAASSIDYASGAVVSKTILKNAAGNISLFAFDAGEGLAEHSSPHAALVQVLDGEAEITIGGLPHMLHAGECLLMPANVPHALKATQAFKMMLTMIKG